MFLIRRCIRSQSTTTQPIKKKPVFSYLLDPYKLFDKLEKLFKRNDLVEVSKVMKEARTVAHATPVWNYLIQEYGKRGMIQEAIKSYNSVKLILFS